MLERDDGKMLSTLKEMDTDVHGSRRVHRRRWRSAGRAARPPRAWLESRPFARRREIVIDLVGRSTVQCRMRTMVVRVPSPLRVCQGMTFPEGEEGEMERTVLAQERMRPHSFLSHVKGLKLNGSRRSRPAGPVLGQNTALGEANDSKPRNC